MKDMIPDDQDFHVVIYIYGINIPAYHYVLKNII